MSHLSVTRLGGVNTLVPNFTSFPPAAGKREVEDPVPGSQGLVHTDLGEYIGFPVLTTGAFRL